MNQSHAAIVLGLLAAAGGPAIPGGVEVSDPPKPKAPKLPSDSAIRHERMVGNRMAANKGCEKNSVETRVTRRAAERKKLLAELRNPRTVRKAIRKILFGGKKKKGTGPRWMRHAKKWKSNRSEGIE